MSDAFLDAAAPMIAGMLVQVFLLLRPTAADARDLGICLLGALLAFLPFKHEVDYEPARHVFFACLLFVWMLTFVFRDRLLPRIQEGIVIVWTCLFVYSAYSAIGLLHPAGWLLLAVSLFVLVILALRMTFAFAAKLSIYCWYLLAVTVTVGLQFRFADLGLFFRKEAAHVSPVAAIIDGMAFVYLGIVALFLFRMVPIPGKSQSMASRMQEWREDAAAMVERLSDVQVSPEIAVGIAIVFCSVFALNTRYEVVRPFLLVNVLMVTMPVYTGWLALAQSRAGARRTRAGNTAD